MLMAPYVKSLNFSSVLTTSPALPWMVPFLPSYDPLPSFMIFIIFFLCVLSLLESSPLEFIELTVGFLSYHLSTVLWNTRELIPFVHILVLWSTFPSFLLPSLPSFSNHKSTFWPEREHAFIFLWIIVKWTIYVHIVDSLHSQGCGQITSS